MEPDTHDDSADSDAWGYVLDVACDSAVSEWGGVEQDTYTLWRPEGLVATISRDLSDPDALRWTMRLHDCKTWLVEYDNLLIQFLTFLRDLAAEEGEEFASGAFCDEDGEDMRRPFRTDALVRNRSGSAA
jgi:hypothetical protein